jgi:hypothetical protein
MASIEIWQIVVASAFCRSGSSVPGGIGMSTNALIHITIIVGIWLVVAAVLKKINS